MRWKVKDSQNFASFFSAKDRPQDVKTGSRNLLKPDEVAPV